MFLAALALRLGPFPDATSRSWRLLSPDCYGHLRRTVSVARDFPRVPYRDPYLNHPDGGVFIWPPAFDLVAGGAALALGEAAAGRPPTPTARMFARRVHESDAPHPAPFLESVLPSRTGTRRADESFQPRFRVFRVLEAAAP